MRPRPFELERYFARYEFSVRRTLCSSDCQPLSMAWLLERADAQMRSLWDSLTLGYTESQGAPLLRAEVAALYRGIGAGQVLTAVPEEGILLAMNALLGPGDHVVCTWPGYQSLFELAEDLGCRVSRWEPRESEGWRFAPEDLARLARPDTRLIVCNFPHNPTGYLPPREEWEGVVQVARERGCYLFSDEMYRLLEADAAQRLPAAVELYERAVSLSGLSKAYGLAGLRTGWLVTRDEALMRSLCALKDYTTICASAPGEVLATIALRAGEEILGVHRRRLAAHLPLLAAFLADHTALFAWHPPRAGSVCFPRYRGRGGATALCHRLAQEHGLLLLPSSAFAYGDAHVRFGYGRADFPAALDDLRGRLAQMGGR